MATLVDIPVDFEQSLIEFSTSLYQGLNKADSVCLSPCSIIAALLLVMIGANGQSKEQISAALFQNSLYSEEQQLKFYKSLHSQLTQRAGVNVSFASANRLFVSDQFTVFQNVQENAKRYFGADISVKNFRESEASAYEMNNWVSEQTDGKIEDLIKKDWLNQNTVMFIINAVYFKATWKRQFPPENTKKENFYLPNNNTIEVEMMNNGMFIKYFRGIDFSAVALPFKGGNFDMVFILPNEKHGLPNIEAKITPKFLSSISAGFITTFAIICIPKFKLQTEFDLTNELPKLGVKDIFDQAKANFSNLINEKREGVYVDVAVHKAVFNVNEAGVEGAATTVIGFSLRSVRLQFKANKPFLFYVRDIKSGLILFIGRFHPQVN
ncbi:antithrombin III [Mytilus galloprovincialis]|uniref:Antithrombin III n=1 Tax=Mytilus galloprovincialis TaxID=29158 RepID=A0A8B6G9U8_MYTGA|nr:antithrombin III [Mytilus galloprovincialis]